MSSSPRGLEATLDRWEGDVAVLRTADGQEILWPADQLPEGVAEGGVLQLVVASAGDRTDAERDAAKNLLNEIFGSRDAAQG